MSDSARAPAAYGLHPYQRQVARELLGFLAPSERRVVAENRRAVAHLPTGAGKTRIASYVACQLLNARDDALVVWLASREELCDQAADELARAWACLGNREVSVHRYWGDSSIEVNAQIGEGFLVAGLAKMLAAAQRSTGLLVGVSDRLVGVVFDEAHQAIAKTYEYVTEQLLTYRPPLLGLTATPGRKPAPGEEDRRLAEMFNFNKVSIDPKGHPDPVTYLIKNDYLADPEIIPIAFDSSLAVVEPTGDGDYRRQDLEALGKDSGRSDLVIQTTLEVMERNKRVIVFCPSVENALDSAHTLRREGVRAEAVTAETPTEERQAIVRDFRADTAERIALLNYGVLTAGFDAPRTRCVIIARPTTSLVLYSQMVGRAMRGTRSGGNRTCEVYTVVDTNLPGFRSVTEAFGNWEAMWSSS